MHPPLRCDVCEAEVVGLVVACGELALCGSCYLAEDEICGSLVGQMQRLHKAKRMEDAQRVATVLRKFFGPKEAK